MEEKRNYGRWILWFGTSTAIIAVFILVSNMGGNNSIEKYLPYGLLLLCPLSHLFMMNMHNHKQSHTKDNEDKSCH